jgi:hypothetical protein
LAGWHNTAVGRKIASTIEADYRASLHLLGEHRAIEIDGIIQGTYSRAWKPTKRRPERSPHWLVVGERRLISGRV